VQGKNRNQLQPKSVKAKFVGFDQHAKGFRVSCKGKIILSREVRFIEDIERKRQKTRRERSPEMIGFEPEEDETQEVPESTEQRAEESDEEFFDAEEEAEPVEVPAAPEPRRTTRTTAGKLPQRFSDYVMSTSAMFAGEDPITDRQAMQSDDAERWKIAKQQELEAIKGNNTWETVSLPAGKRAIGSKWVFKTKTDEHGRTQYKARLVAQGFTQKEGIDFTEVFAPVANSATVRVLLTVAGIKSYAVRHYDVKSAFLNGDLKEEIYMKPPPGVNENGKVYRLKKSLYGLKQAANVWNEKLKQTLQKHQCIQSKDDECLYAYTSGGVKIYLLVHVDDILAASNSTFELQKFMHKIGKEFELKDLGEVKTYLGIDIHRNEEGFFEISQERYIERILEATEMTSARVSPVPMSVGYHKSDGVPLSSNTDYRKLIGMLLYASVNSRPDIAAAVSILCQKVSAPTDTDLNEAKRVIRYLKGTKSFRLRLGTSKSESHLCAFSDSDWAESRIDRKSNSGIVCLLNGAPVIWKSKKQTIVATSSAEAEYVALSLTVKEIIWLRRIVESFEIHQKGPLKVFSDSQSAMAMVMKPKLSGRTKHIDTKFHHVKDSVERGVIELEYVPTNENVADVLTKPLGNVKLTQFRSSLGLR
jgi:hypothetical protein